MAATSSREGITLFCLVYGEPSKHLIPVRISKCCFVGDLRKLIKEEKRPEFDHIAADKLRLWKVSICRKNKEELEQLVLEDNLDKGIQELDPLDEIGDVFQDVVKGYIQVIVQPPTEGRAAKRTDIAEVMSLLPASKRVESDISAQKELHAYGCSRFNGKLPSLDDLSTFLNESLPDQLKVPRPESELIKNILKAGHQEKCLREDLEVLFRVSEQEDQDFVHVIESAVFMDPPAGSSEHLFHRAWDLSILCILNFFIDEGISIRDRSFRTSTGIKRPDLGFILKNACVFRGEEKGPETRGEEREELCDKLIWTYDPAEYVLGYYARGCHVTLVAICAPKPRCKPEIRELAHANLRSKVQRILHVRRMINLSCIIPLLANTVQPRTVPESNKIITFSANLVEKQYRIMENDEVTPTQRIKKLSQVYDILGTKAVPNVDKLRIADETKGLACLEPVGDPEVKPGSERELFQALICILEALAKMHTAPDPIFHRDIRWPNVVRLHTGSDKWILIDWDDAAWPPTHAAKHLDIETHAPEVFHDGHGGEVDIWAIGHLISTSNVEPSDRLQKLKKWTCGSPRPNAQQVLREIRKYVSPDNGIMVNDVVSGFASLTRSYHCMGSRQKARP